MPFGTLLIVASSSVQSALYQVSVRQATILLSLLLPATSRWSGLGVAIRFVGNYALWDFHPRFGTCPSYYKMDSGDCSPLPNTLCVDQIVVYDLYCPVPDVVHPLYPLHLIVCFEFFGDAFLFGTPYVTVAFATPTKQQLNIIIFIHISRYIF